MNTVIKVEHLTKKYKEKLVLDDISFDVKQGDILGILGKNGAGKSTLIRIIANLITSTQGQIFIDGQNTKSNTDYIQKIGVLLEGGKNIYHFLSVEDNLYYFSYLNKIPKSQVELMKAKLMAMFELEGKEKQIVSQLSRGMQQKVSLMVLFLKNPDILILDEPILGLDLLSIIQFKNFIKELSMKINKTIIICSHDINFIFDVCEKVMVLKDGKNVYFDEKKNIVNAYKKDYSILLNLLDETKLKKFTYEIIDNKIYKVTTSSLKDILETFSDDEIIDIEKNNIDVEEFVKNIYLGDKS